MLLHWQTKYGAIDSGMKRDTSEREPEGPAVCTLNALFNQVGKQKPCAKGEYCGGTDRYQGAGEQVEKTNPNNRHHNVRVYTSHQARCSVGEIHQAGSHYQGERGYAQHH